MLSFRSVLFGILIIGGVAFAQEATTVSELQSLETQPAVDDSASTSDVVVKGFIPDLQRAQMVEDAVTAAKKAEQKKAAAAAVAKTQAERKTADTSKKTETAAEKERKAREAADRANGILPGKPAAQAKAKKTLAATKSDASDAAIPAEPLDNKPEQPVEKSKVIVEEVPTASGKSVGVKKMVPLDEESDSPGAKSSAGASASTGDTLTVNGRVTSVVHGSGGKLRLMLDSSSQGLVEVLVEPRPGMRVPTTGASVTVRGKKVGGNDRTTVVRAERIDRPGATSNVLYRHGYVKRIIPQVPLGPGGPLGPPFMGPMPPPPPYF
ncbi:MAG: hypothetical protein ACR2IE_16385 [Candidatus Sumerlaeaceae bacterium]